MRVLVVGAGLGGLSCAFTLARSGADVVVCEAAPRAGGVVGSIEQDGFRFETGPHTVLPSAATFRTLCDELGVLDRLVPSSPRAKTRYLWFRGRLEPLPQHPLRLLKTPLLSLKAKARLASEPLRRRAPIADEAPEPSLGELLRERIGPEPTARLAGAFVRGIYAGDVDALGARSAFPRLWSLVQEHGSILRGMRAKMRAAKDARPLPGPEVPRGRLISLAGGLETFVDALGTSLGSRLRTNARVEELTRKAEDPSAAWTARLSTGEILDAEHVVLCIPARNVAELLGDRLSQRSGELLAGIAHANLTVAHLGFLPVPPESVPEGFGYLVPPTETGPGVPRALGTIFASNLFEDRAPAGGFSVASFYRTNDLPQDDDAAARFAADELRAALAWPEAPPLVAQRVMRWPSVLPQYTRGHRERMQELETQLQTEAPGIAIAASFLGGVSVEDVLARGRAVALRLQALDRQAGSRT